MNGQPPAPRRTQRRRGDAVPEDTRATEIALPGGAFAKRLQAALAAPSLGAIVWSLVAGLLVGGVSGLALLGQGPTYTSQAVLLIDQPQAIAASGDPGVLQKLSQLRGKYAPLIDTDPVIERGSRLGDVPEKELRDHVSAVVPVNTLTLVVVGAGGSPSQARRVAHAGAAGLIAFAADEQETEGIAPDQQFEFELVATPDRTVKILPKWERVMAVAGTVWLLAGIAAYLALAAVAARRGI